MGVENSSCDVRFPLHKAKIDDRLRELDDRTSGPEIKPDSYVVHVSVWQDSLVSYEAFDLSIDREDLEETVENANFMWRDSCRELQVVDVKKRTSGDMPIYSIESRRGVLDFMPWIDGTDPYVRQVAHALTKNIPADDPFSHEKRSLALLRFVQSLKYTPDYGADEVKKYEVVMPPAFTLAYGGGDCDDLVILYASLLEALGMPYKILLTSNHSMVGVPGDFDEFYEDNGISFLLQSEEGDNGWPYFYAETTDAHRKALIGQNISGDKVNLVLPDDGKSPVHGMETEGKILDFYVKNGESL